MDKIKEQIEKEIDKISEEGVSVNNADYLYRLVDIHKDIKNEEYWKVKEDKYEKELQRIRRIW